MYYHSVMARWKRIWILCNTTQSPVNVIYRDSDIRSSASNFDRSFLRLFYASYWLKCQYFQKKKRHWHVSQLSAMLFLLAAILASRVFLWRQLLQRLPNLHIVVWRKYDIKNLVLCVVRAYFEISISLKVHKKVYSGIAVWKRIWNVLKPAE